MNEIKVTFLPAKEDVYVLPGTTVLEAAERAGILIENPCAGTGSCGKCKVRIVEGRTKQEFAQNLAEEDIAAGCCLACQTRVTEESVVEVPRESFESEMKQILSSGQNTGLQPKSAVEEIYFVLDPPSREDFASDLDRLQQKIGECSIPYPFRRSLPTFLRSNEWRGTATIVNDLLIDLEAGDTRGTAAGIALDLGTTTIVGALFNLATGEELAVSARMNPQSKHGADVISRISCVRGDKENLETLHNEAIAAINSIVDTLTAKSGVDAKKIYELAIAGNSTMQEFLLGMDPSPLGELPFVQAFNEAQTVMARDMGIGINPHAQVFVFPQIGGFVGGDTVAAMQTTLIDNQSEPSLIIDIGTNGEIVLANGDSLKAASAAAGPALEGARISQGMRAADGAIEKIYFEEGEVLSNVIGNRDPVGICGSALIDVVAELLRCGIVSVAGRLHTRKDTPPDCPAGLRDRVVEYDGGLAFEIVAADETAKGAAVRLTQKDISELQLAVGAIRAATEILLKKSGLQSKDLGSVMLAGAFGNYIRKVNAHRIGLIPQVGSEKIHFIGNAALYGAKNCLLSYEARKQLNDLAKRTKHVDLSMDPDFQEHFTNAMFFPSGDSI